MGGGEGEVAGIPWGLDSQNSHCPQEFDRRLWNRGGTLDICFSEKTEEIMSKFEGMSRGCFDKIMSHGLGIGQFFNIV